MDLNQIKLKKEGVATLQTFFIVIFASLEHLIRQSYGIVTGLIVLTVAVLGNRFGRAGVSYVAAVTPPLAFGATALLWSLLAYNIHITKVAVDLIGSLASIVPWMILGAIYGWYTFFNKRAKSKVAAARSRV